MFTAILGAVAIADIIVFVVLGLGLVLGLFGGLAKAFKGLFATLSIILISLLLVGVTIGPMSSSSLGNSLSGALEGKAQGWGAAFSSPVYVGESNGQPIMEGGHLTYCVEVNGELTTLENAAGDGVLGKIKGKLAVKLAQHYITQDNDGAPLASYAADALAKLIWDVVLFVAYCIVLGVAFYLLRKLFKNMHKADSVGVRVLDRALGAVVAAGLALLALLLVFAIVKLAAPEGSKVAQFFENANIAGALYTKNPMSKALTKLF